MDKETKDEKLERLMLSVLNVVCILGPILFGMVTLINISTLYFAGK